MLSTISDINALRTESSSATLMGTTGSGIFPTDSGAAASAFQGQLDKAMQQGSGMQSTNKENAVGKDTGVSLSEDSSVQTQDSLLTAAGQTSNLSTGEQNTEISTLEKSRFAVRAAKQKVSDLEDALKNGGGSDFLKELKSLLLSISNYDLDNLSLDKEGLNAIGDLLVQAGFDQASVEEMLSDLTLTLEEGDSLISVSSFMDNLFELPLAEDEDITQAETLMPTSDFPYIKTLLSMMGVDDQEITSIMDEASEGTRGFDFDTFIKQLEQLLNTTSESGLTYQTNDGDDAYTTLLQQLDLDSFIETSDEPLTLATLIDAFAQKLNLIKENQANQTEHPLSEIFTTDSFDALATQSGRHGLLNQFFSGLDFQEGREETADSTIPLNASSDAMAKEIGDRFQVQFMDQINRHEVSTKTTAEAPAIGNTAYSSLQTKKTDSDDAFKITSSFSDTAGASKESASQISIKAAQADAAALETVTSATNSQSGDSMSKNSETQTLVFGVEKSTTTATVGTSDTQRTQQAFSTLPDFVTRQVGKNIVRSINTGDDTIRMQLKPPELGRVYLSIDHNGNAIKVSVITEHQSAKDILAANINEIKTMLSSSGISLESFEVDMSSDFQQSMADARAQGQSTGKKQAKRGARDDAQEDVADNLTVQTATINDSGSLHFVA